MSRVHLRTLVLAGGPSAEREVSLKSGLAVVAALESRRHRVSCFDPRQESIGGIDPSEFDVVFIALHGRYGEDGTVQSQLESAGFAYTGSGPAASALAFCKSASKRRFRQCGIPTPIGIEFRCDEPSDQILDRVSAHPDLNRMVVVKPDCQGSSIGVSFARTRTEIEQAIRDALQHDSSGLIEAAIPGEEWTVPFLDNRALPPIRIGTQRSFFDYEAKYLSDETRYEFPDDSELSQHVIKTARRAVDSLGVTGLSRVDLRVDPSGQPWVLEVNTIPGLTDHSLAPKAAARAGIPFPELCEQLCLRAIAVHASQQYEQQIRNSDNQNSPFRRVG